MAEAVSTSAVNMNASDREHEAIRRAQRAHEPSMEEILASIRTIIAEEREPAKASEAKEPPSKAAATAPQPQIVHARAEARAPATPPPRPDVSPETEPPKVVWRQPGPRSGPDPALQPDPAEPSPPPQPARDDAPLLSPETDKAVGSAFDALSANLAARSAERAEEMARAMLRPMLKAWLDENLPGIVERLVSAEIERVVRGTR